MTTADHDDRVRAADVAYLVGQYPRASQTFIRQEIAAVERAGVAVERISINEPAGSDLLTADARAEQQRTFYVKGQSKAAVARALVRAVRANPGAAGRTLLTALRAAGTDVRALLWWVFYFVEAVVVWDHGTRTGVRRLHALFAHPASNVAWLAAELGNRIDGAGSWSWLLTIHGIHDFYDQSVVKLDRKIASADAVICIADSLRAQVLRQIAPEHWPKVVVRRCGIDLGRFEMRPPRPPREPSVIVTVGRLAPEKGQAVLIEAASILRRRGVETVVELVGDGPQRDALVAEATRLGVGDAVRFAGEVAPDEVGKVLADADVFCLPSFGEGIPISIMEAMAVGVPVVATYVGGVPELVVDRVTGRVVAPGRPDLLADALAEVLRDEAARSAMVTAARARVERDHDLSRTTSELVPVVTGAALELPA